MSARDILIDSAVHLARRRGVSGTAINALLEHSGVARRTVYLNFPGGKNELLATATRHSGRLSTDLIALWDPAQPPAVALNTFVAWWKTVLTDSDFDAGCPIVAAALGRDEAPDAADAAGEVFADWQRIVAARLRTYGIARAAAASLATTVVAAVEGAVVLCLAHRSTTPLDRVGRHLVELVELHLPADGRAKSITRR